MWRCGNVQVFARADFGGASSAGANRWRPVRGDAARNRSGIGRDSADRPGQGAGGQVSPGLTPPVSRRRGDAASVAPEASGLEAISTGPSKWRKLRFGRVRKLRMRRLLWL